MTNREHLYNIRAKVLSSMYWISKIQKYYISHIYTYGPIIKDDLFKSLFNGSRTVGVLEMEKALGRPFKIEELEVSPLSVEYLTLGDVLVTESRGEGLLLDSFDKMIDEGIRKQEGRFVARKIRDLEIWKIMKYRKSKDMGE